jgi:aspartyl-tRNA(Asn)/glutamyl-tRNA(Gln) amidotransferase subunit B
MSTNSIDTIINGYEVVIGIEVHVQLNTLSKIFCADSTSFGAGDNENISPISLGMPGTLPTLNRGVLDLAIKTGLALNCHIRAKSFFARKNYFYPDLPKGYQISQYEEPICENGFVEFSVEGQQRKVSITRAHLEEDAGKSTHFPEHTLLNYNRAGIPLLEIVSGPDMKSAKEAAEYCKTIRAIVQYLDVCDGNLEEGSLRCDCNVSVKKVGDPRLGTKVELKNLNSFRFIEKALDFEIERQIDLCLSNKKIIQETRLYDPDKNRTYTMRLKEDAQDYRYFIDPDLLPIIVAQDKIKQMRDSIPELPIKKAERFIKELGLSEGEADTLTSDKALANFFEATSSASGHSKQSANWILGEVLRYSNEHHQNIAQIKVTPDALAELIKLIEQKVVSVKIAKAVFNEMMNDGSSAASIIDKHGYKQVSDTGELEKMIQSVLDANASQLAEYRSGKEKVFGFFVGAVMKLTKGQADPDIVNKLLKQKLSGT